MNPVEPTDFEPAAPVEKRTDRLAAAVKAWTGELIDLGGRNTLLYYRDLKQGTLDLGPGSAAEQDAVGRLLASRTTRLSATFNAASVGSAARRARTVKAKAAENFEERGLRTLFLAWGMATWSSTHGTATPAAPVLLREASVSARGSAGEDFDLALLDEWDVNPTLLHLLKTEHQIELDAEALLQRLDERSEPPDPTRLFQGMVGAAAPIPGFSIAPRVVIGNFSYAKLPMVLDLENEADALLQSELVCALAGDEAARDSVRATHPTVSLSDPDHIPPRDEFLVLDADASQSYVINAVVAGADLVVDGPPGTGKSQTIANLIATLSARGQRILFVAEKRAAIDAVLRRLDAVGLGALVLDLHEGAGSKRKLAADLAHVLEVTAAVPKPDLEAAHERLVRTRNVLVGRHEAVHQARSPWGLSLYEVQARLLGIPVPARSRQRLRGDRLTRLDSRAFADARADLEAMIELDGLHLASGTSPWAEAYTAGMITTSDTAAAVLEAASTLSGHTLPTAAACLGQAADACGLTPPKSVADWEATLTLLDRAASILAQVDASIFDTPPDELLAGLAAASRGGFARVLAWIGSGRYRRARVSACKLWRGTGKPSSATLHATVARAAELATAWAAASPVGSKPHLPPDLASCHASYRQLRTELAVLQQWLPSPLDGLPVSAIAARLATLLADTQTLARLPDLTRLRTTLDRIGLGPLVGEIATRNLTVDQALASLDHVWLTSILEAVSLADGRVGSFDGDAHRRTIATYRSNDRAHISAAAERVSRAVAEHATAARDAYPRENDVIQHQAHLRRGHLPIRQLFQAAPHVLPALKPCWAMSPLVVAQLLPARRHFDVVIFDEASQVTPADAIGSLARAERVVVAGDPHQLPPTSFFMASGGGEDDEEAEADALASSMGTRNMESILDAMSSLLPPPRGTRTLGWHYRSKDERLIAFSNAQPTLYDWRLTTFPGIAGPDSLRHVLVPFRPGRVHEEDSIGDEVGQVVGLVADHARARPGESLGVIAMGLRHANRIEEALRQARLDDKTLDSFLDGTDPKSGMAEPFFVKNLERVQGDERDAIILTIGYGKTADGRMLYRFGPINNEGGQRRLNVAVTRARSRMTVVSSFSAADMDVGRLRSDGAQMLARYLSYAESGGADLGTVIKDKPELNPFERDVLSRLTERGVPLIAQFGCSGYWIDFAAPHPDRPGQMVLAIECDGATYHSSATARDRDRLRQEHLERLGWTFHRIWSQEWFFHRDAEIARAVTAYRAAVAAAGVHRLESGGSADGRQPTTALAAAPRPFQPDDTLAPRRPGTCPVRPYRGSIDDYSMADLVAVVRWVQSDTLLRTEEELVAESMHALGFERRGARILGALRTAIARARRAP